MWYGANSLNACVSGRCDHRWIAHMVWSSCTSVLFVCPWKFTYICLCICICMYSCFPSIIYISFIILSYSFFCPSWMHFTCSRSSFSVIFGLLSCSCWNLAGTLLMQNENCYRSSNSLVFWYMLVSVMLQLETTQIATESDFVSFMVRNARLAFEGVAFLVR